MENNKFFTGLLCGLVLSLVIWIPVAWWLFQ